MLPPHMLRHTLEEHRYGSSRHLTCARLAPCNSLVGTSLASTIRRPWAFQLNGHIKLSIGESRDDLHLTLHVIPRVPFYGPLNCVVPAVSQLAPRTDDPLRDVEPEVKQEAQWLQEAGAAVELLESLHAYCCGAGPPPSATSANRCRKVDASRLDAPLPVHKHSWPRVGNMSRMFVDSDRGLV